MARKLRILMVSSEAWPWSGAGGLSDSVGALSDALAARGHKVNLLIPHVPRLLPANSPPLVEVAAFNVATGGTTVPARVLAPETDSPVRPLMLSMPALFDRPAIYGENGVNYTDNCTRFTALCRAANLLGSAVKVRYDVMHCHDWPSGLAPYLSREARLAGGSGGARSTVFTVHNASYQGLFWGLDLPILGLGPEHYTTERLEFFGKLSFLKAGLIAADKVTTVSATYARELLSVEAGMGLDGLLLARAAAFQGVPLGIDTARWNPAVDPALAAPFSDATALGRRVCGEALRKELGIPMDAHPLLSVIGPVQPQKGADVLVEAAHDVVTAGAHLAVFGSGDASLERELRALAIAHPGRIAFVPGFDEPRMHRALAGSDFLLSPSRVEPAAHLAMAALRYGTPPVVRRTGALRDVVVDVDVSPAQGTGITYVGEGAGPLLGAVARAVALHRDTVRYSAAQRMCMTQDVSCSPSAARYEALYLETLTAEPSREKAP